MSSSSSFGSGVFGSSALGTQPFFNTSSLIDAILYATGHGSPANETSKRRAITQFINNKYQEIITGTHWRWLKAAYDVNFEAPYDTGTISVTNGDYTVTGASTSWNAGNVTAKRLLWLNSSETVYHVASLTNSTSLELESEFSEDTASAQEYVIVKSQYQLPKETDHIVSMIVDSQYKMVPVGLQDFREIVSRDPTRLDRPQYFTLARRDTDDDSVYIEVWPSPDKQYQVHIDYTVRIAYLEDDTDCYPIIPDRFRAVLYYGALAEFYQFLRDPSNSQLARNDYMTFLNQMRNDTQLTDDRFKIQSAKNYWKRGRALGKRRGTTTIEDFGRGE
jgi:hypothetical protein